MSEIHFGLLLVHYPYNAERKTWAKRSFESLSRTCNEGLHAKPTLLMVIKGIAEREATRVVESFKQFENRVVLEDQMCSGIDSATSWGYYKLCGLFPEVTHIHFLADDFIYNPSWLLRLQEIIERHPGARGWSVYRSGLWSPHTLTEKGGDVLVDVINAMGCLTREEWLDWGVDWHLNTFTDWATLDLYHAMVRKGEYWVTARSYTDTIGVIGLHDSLSKHEFAVDFVGEEL